ncbi:Alpha/Beta hydrolase protein [Bisporella sp. PMI_857]|nr:Alpha/Beta hydrolase protein [Bisporella sp. PMI_857]
MASKFGAFNQFESVYKTIGDTPLKTSILIPKNATNKKFPVLVHFHGGGLMVGDKLFAPWFPMWLAQLAESQEAIIVTPNYRLIPEAKVVQILDDVKDFWSWLHSSLLSEVANIDRSISLDLSKVAVAGESAGGYLSLQSSLLFPEANISVVMAQYGTLDIDSPFYNPPPTKPLEGKSLVDKYLANLKPGEIRLSSPPPDRWDLCEAILAEGRHREMMGTEDKVRLMKSIEGAKSPPPMWLAQGTSDPIMPIATAENFVRKMKEVHPNTPVHFSIQPGSHGFDVSSSLNDDWVEKGCQFIKSYWP